MSKRWVINSCIALALVGLIVLQTMAYRMTSKNEPSQWITKNRETLDSIHQLSVLYKEMELERREYLLTNNYNSLQGMNKSLASLLQTLDKLNGSTKANQAQHDLVNKQLRPRIIERIALINAIIETHTNKGDLAAMTQASSDHANHQSAKITTTIQELEQSELNLLNFNKQQDQNFHRNLALLIFAGSLFSVVAIVIFFFMINLFLDRKIISESLSHNQNQLLESILDCMGDGVLVRDMNGQFILQNPVAAKLTGDNLSKLQIFSEDRKTAISEQELPINKALHGESIDNTIYFVKSSNYPNGIYVNVSARPLINKAGLQRGGVTVFSNVTAIKEAHDQLEAFNYSVSHDLSAPLRTIVGFSQIILEDHGASCTPEAKAALTRIIGATKKMKLVIEGLLELSRLKRTEVNKENIDLSDMVHNIASDLQKLDINRKVNFIIPKNIEASGDPHLLSVVMTNLMNNAYKFTSRKADTIIEFGLIKNNDKDTYFVRDNGAGFDMRHVDKLFGAFERLHTHDEFPGTGIGLATVKQVIDKHSGEIWAQAEVNKGATFYFTL